jgi:IS30 family transposase
MKNYHRLTYARRCHIFIAKARNSWKKYRKSAGRSLMPGRVDISKRTKIVEKKRFGDFEIDTTIGAKHQGAIVSIVDRATKYCWLTMLPNRA